VTFGWVERGCKKAVTAAQKKAEAEVKAALKKAQAIKKQKGGK
jgi:hypothetical protein